MADFELLILLMCVAVLLVSLAQKAQIAYPIVLVLGGALLSFIPGLDYSYFDPYLIQIVVLPPILYYAAFWTSLGDFRKNIREIFSLAFGLVIATTLVVGMLFKWFFPQFSWALAFAFGAIVSPPDAAAACSVLKRFSLGRRLTAILEGESLVNDASALVLYRIAVTAIFTGTFSLWDASVDFVASTAGGTLLGLCFGFIVQSFSRRYLDPVIGAFSSFLIPYATYILALQVGVSGVLAVVASGVLASRMIFKHHSSLRRMLGYATWDLYIILLNCFIFILIGSQLDEVTRHMGVKEVCISTLYALFISFMMFVIRLIWICIKSAVQYLMQHHDAKSSMNVSRMLREGMLIGCAGMRGIVSLTAALSLPLTLNDGSLLHGRPEVIYMTFCVILFSLLLPGFGLERLMQALYIPVEPSSTLPLEIRRELAHVAQEEIARLHSKQTISSHEYDLLRDYVDHRLRIVELAGKDMVRHHAFETARKKVVQQQRQILLRFWEHGHIDDKLFAEIEYELDIEEIGYARAEI